MDLDAVSEDFEKSAQTIWKSIGMWNGFGISYVSINHGPSSLVSDLSDNITTHPPISPNKLFCSKEDIGTKLNAIPAWVYGRNFSQIISEDQPTKVPDEHRLWRGIWCILGIIHALKYHIIPCPLNTREQLQCYNKGTINCSLTD